MEKHVTSDLQGLPVSQSRRCHIFDPPNAMERIIGTDVREEEEATADEERQVIAAIENTGETINAVRMATSLNGIRIVFLSDAIASEGGPTAKVEAKIEEFNGEIRTLRQELEGNAILYHAIDSHHVLIRDVLAVEFDDQKRAIIYAAAKPVP
jgi:hypothetical protein